MEIVLKYFDDFTPTQLQQLSALKELYTDWNSKINVISRKDMDNFYLHHVLHSLTIAAKFEFTPTMQIVDLGCGGGFPVWIIAIKSGFLGATIPLEPSFYSFECHWRACLNQRVRRELLRRFLADLKYVSNALLASKFSVNGSFCSERGFVTNGVS